ncbi:hypothetical protein SAMN06264364_113100 [Quadrisphaera granulorum]|uniref:Type II secretion system (T2SS) protein F n=1 Tax=Quadrisphaera granulorum TaxID=317664 RepID=A0A316A654_9ACTN|nr:hypothetical protein [Quadrisphaera granulorum]PWJ53341.1 hypothetical protein BXY45_113100 [Quadrisphaera granulorum]SZE97015.1 hypothetical protein SAMN06264364_113100 [Quadrisphaera granulorum]
MTAHLLYLVSRAEAPGPWPVVAALLVGLAVLVAPGRPRPPRAQGGAPAPAAVLHVDPALLLDLVAAVVAAGAAPSAAVSAVADVLAEADWPHAAELARVAQSPGTRSAGASAESARGAAQTAIDGVTDAGVADVVLALRRGLWIAEQTGAPVAALLVSAAAELRRRRRRAGALAAARLGVRVVAPLGLCTLPAFGLLAVVPVLLSLGRGLLA